MSDYSAAYYYRRRTRRAAVTLGIVVALGLGGVLGAGCSSDERGIGDAPSEQQPDRPVPIWPNANYYPNVAVICVGGNGVYTTTREAPVAVVVDDPECQPGGAAYTGNDPATEESTEEDPPDEE